jgi:hypothetical protein
MSQFKIEKGISRINRVKLQAAIEESIVRDLRCWEGGRTTTRTTS